jgi:hypothetical protein
VGTLGAKESITVLYGQQRAGEGFIPSGSGALDFPSIERVHVSMEAFPAEKEISFPGALGALLASSSAPM